MSPLEIHCLLEYYTMPNGSPDIKNRHPMGVEALLRMGLIGGQNEDTSKPMHTITDRGKAMVEHLIGQPLPEKHWIVPIQENRNEQ